MRARPSWPIARVAAAALLFAGCYPTDDLQAPDAQLTNGDLGFFVSKISDAVAVHVLSRNDAEGWRVHASTNPNLPLGPGLTALPFLMTDGDSLSLLVVRRDQLLRDDEGGAAQQLCPEEKAPSLQFALQVEVASSAAAVPNGACTKNTSVRLRTDVFCPVITDMLNKKERVAIVPLVGSATVTLEQVWAKLPPRPDPCN